MQKLSNNERLVLLALQAHTPGLTEMQLELITHLPSETLHDSLLALETLSRAGSVVDRNETYHVAMALSDQPLFPHWEAWLAYFCDALPQFVEGDTLATTYDQCGVVLLTAILGGTRDSEAISRVTSLPLPFVMLVLGMADRRNIWDLDSTFELQRRLAAANSDLRGVDNDLHWLKEQFWEFCWTPDIEATLHQFRAGHQVGGKMDWWIDSEVAARCGAPTIH